ADRDAGGCGCPSGDRGRAARARNPPAGPRRAARARPAGVREERRRGWARRDVHLAHGGRARARGGNAGHGSRRGPRALTGDLARPGGGPGLHAGGRRFRRVRAGTRVIVRWGLEELPGLLAELGIGRPFLVASARWSAPIEVWGAWTEVPSHRILEAATAAGGAGSILALGGGSAIDLAKAISVETGLPL